jgi:hypothetical protein
LKPFANDDCDVFCGEGVLYYRKLTLQCEG